MAVSGSFAPAFAVRFFHGVSPRKPGVVYLLLLGRDGALSSLLQSCCSVSPWTGSALAPSSSFTDPFAVCPFKSLCQPILPSSLRSKGHRTIIAADSFAIMASTRSLHVRSGLSKDSLGARLWAVSSVKCSTKCACVSGARPQWHSGDIASATL